MDAASEGGLNPFDADFPAAPSPLRRPRIQLSLPLQRFAMIAAVLILFTSSFDIFLVINAAGNYRFCQVVLLLLIALGIIKALWTDRLVLTIGSLWLSIWFLFQVVFIPVTDFWPKAVGYCFWLLLNIGMMFCFVQLFSDNARAIQTLAKWYLYSFAFVAAFGIFQFLLPVSGLPGILIAQWWIPGILPRVNGFSYEPSYFACYLLIGFVLVNSLRRARSPLLSSKRLSGLYYLIALGIVVSSSRLGIVFLLIEVFLSGMTPWVTFLSGLRKLRVVRSNLRSLVPSLLVFSFLLALFGCAMALVRSNPVLLLMFLNGTGVSDTAAHSVIQRENSLQETIAVFAQHPFIGRSLGGISAAIADHEGYRIRSFEDAKKVEGMSVFAEVLTASGVIGFVPFLCFVVVTIRNPLRLARIVPPLYASLLRGLVRSLVFTWAILQFNQNVLRTYLWAHLAILATVYAAALNSTDNRRQPSGIPHE